MGYCYGYNERGQLVLACDYCGKTGGVRKRTCPHMVTTEDGHKLHYCSPPAMCSECYARVGGSKAIHVNCAEGAAAHQAEYDRRRAKLEAGEAQVRTAWGDWYETVPAGMVGVSFVGADKVPHYMLVTDYEPGTKRWLSDYPDAQPWIDHPGVTSKRVM